MKYFIAIPSYKRVETFKSKTYEYLLKTNVDMKKVYLFVVKEDYKEYYASLVGSKINIVVGKEGLKEQRNFIRNYFKEGSFVFSLDDDVAGLYKSVNVKKFSLIEDLDSFIKEGFSLCAKFKRKLWGVSAVLNAMFMFNTGVSFDLKYIVGAAFGQIIDHRKILNQTIDDKGDYERSILYHIHCGGNIRFNYVAVKTNYYKEKGGMQETRTKERVEKSGRYLLQKYPKHCSINTAKKNKEFFEIKLNKNA